MGSKSSIIYILTFLAVAIAPAFVHAGSLPPLINFQSVLLDEGGNLLPSGPTTVQFQILDENQAPIYSETQSVEVVKGAVNALVGNGSDTKGVTTGGIPEDIFAGGAPRYLQVQVGSHAPEDPMTIVPVPYAQWSQTCATVADGAVAAGKIAKAAVGFENLAPDVVSKLASVLTAQSLGSNGGATQIGVAAKFINSGSSSVQGVLQDIDLSVKKRQEETTFLTGKLNQEVTNRTNSISEVKKQFDPNESNSLAQKLNQEADTRSKTDINLQGQIDPIKTTLQDINNISGKLKLDHLEPSSSAVSDLNMGGKKITNLGLPSSQADAVTKSYVDGAISASKNESLSTSESKFKSLSDSTLKIEEGSFIGDGKSRTIALSTITNLKQVHLLSEGAGPGGLTFWRMENNKVLVWGRSQNGSFANSNGSPDGGTITTTTNSFAINDSQWNATGFPTYWIAIGQ